MMHALRSDSDLHSERCYIFARRCSITRGPESLSRLGNLIRDSTSAAVTDLYLLLNDSRYFHFHKVVHLDLMFSTLANDLLLIARKITKLFIPSYFPSKVTEEEAFKSCITLINRSPTVGARFFEFAATERASLRSIMKLFKVIIGLTLSSVMLDEEQIKGLLLLLPTFVPVLQRMLLSMQLSRTSCLLKS
ncbi:hypothetical protein BUALT_Bualt04G0120300 [Buddleja alternifolia]|uniref:Uncharacterized protein n=1 Tax=Buddleja alternifolia TaxID=168488 RepID=A0AAV6XUP5_9LAMI|nr:hypothetical protein BUALT_Bualt04G0120300 [Buddleja alternifolia]